MVQLFIFTRHPPPGRRTGGPRVIQSSIFARYPPPERPVRTLSGPGVHLYSPSTSVKAFPDRERSSRSYSSSIRGQEGVSGPRMVQLLIFIRYPLSATRKAHPDPEWSFFTRHPAPGGRFRAANGPAVYPHSISATRKAYPEPEGSRRLSSLAIHRREGASGARVVHLHSPSAAGRAFSGRELSSRLSPLDILHEEGVSGPRVVQPFIFTRYPPPRKAHPDRELSRRLSSLDIRHQEGV